MREGYCHGIAAGSPVRDGRLLPRLLPRGNTAVRRIAALVVPCLGTLALTTCAPLRAQLNWLRMHVPFGTGPIAFDASRGRLVLVASSNSLGNRVDTFEWQGTWQQRAPARVPPPRSNPALAYDAARRRVVMFGGEQSNYLGDTWL